MCLTTNERYSSSICNASFTSRPLRTTTTPSTTTKTIPSHRPPSASPPSLPSPSRTSLSVARAAAQSTATTAIDGKERPVRAITHRTSRISIGLKMKLKCGLILFVFLIIPYIESGYVREAKAKRLNEYISHYETLNYDDKHLHASHSRAKRSVTKDHHVYLRFNAHERDFHIRLKRDISTFSDNLRVDSTDGPIYNLDTSHIYQGEIVGDRGSHVFGSIIDGVFEGKIISSKDSYYVENRKHYFPNKTDSNNDLNFHSIIYKEDHVDDPYRKLRKGHESGCGITDEISQWMDSIQNSAVEDEDIVIDNNLNNNKNNLKYNNNINSNNNYNKKYNNFKFSNNFNKKIHDKPNNNNNKNKINYDEDDVKYPHQKYSKIANWHDQKDEDYDDEAWHERSHDRMKRATRAKEENKNTCSLYIQTDPLIWRHVREGIVDHDRGSTKKEIDDKTREEITSLIAHHVTAVNYIYRNTKFDGRIEHRNIRFEVQRIKIDDDSACTDSYNGESNPFCMENIDVSNFLNLHSLGNHEIFCLAYVFTYRDFTGGTLGLAWVASASGASGGICEKYKTYTETVGGLYQSTKRSLNTGIITFVNYNSRVPPKVSQLTLAHEIGHNFGSPHDYPVECRPGGVNGNYIMFASATSGDRPNNSKFSTCSVRNISNVLDAIEDSKKRNCFQASEGAFCGNKIVESGEECDCGFNDDECHDKCCYPRLISEADLGANQTAKGCTRRARTQCSPSQGPCCLSETCTFIPVHHRQKCKEETECSWSSTCNGTTPECPEPKPKDNKTKCNNGTQLCISGECAGSICLLWNMTECFLTSNIIPNIDKRKLCELACQNGNDTNTCRSTSEFAHLIDLPIGGISLRPGSPCDNFQGYCDVLLKCRAVDADGPLVRLKNVLFNKKTLQTVAQWVTENWYAVVLMGIIFIIFMGMFIKCCAVHTPSSNPKKAPHRRISDTLRRPMHTLRRMRHHHGRPAGGAGPRSIPPPQGEQRSRSGGPSHGGSRSGGGGGHSSEGERGGGGGGRGDSRRGASGAHASQGGRGAGSRAPPAHGYGEGRGQQYYPPKVNAPPLAQNYSRVNNAELYAEAYPDRAAYEIPQPLRHHNNKV